MSQLNELHERAPCSEDKQGGVVVHRCHPDADPQDFLAFGEKIVEMRGYEHTHVYLFDGEAERIIKPGPWQSAVDAFHIREGSHEDCSVCRGTVDRVDLLQEVVDHATDAIRTHVTESVVGIGPPKGVVYFDDKPSGGWSEIVENHPYVHAVRARRIGTINHAQIPSNSLRITLKTWYPRTVPEAMI